MSNRNYFVDDAYLRFNRIKKRVNENKSLRDKVYRYTAHMHVKYDLPRSEFNDYYRHNLKRSRHDKEFRGWVFKEY